MPPFFEMHGGHDSFAMVVNFINSLLLYGCSILQYGNPHMS
jgi:hypothetical protein